MSRGALMLRAVREGAELEYQPVAGACGAGRDAQVRGRMTGSGGGMSSRSGRKDYRSPTSTRSSGPELGLTKGDLLQYYADVLRRAPARISAIAPW